MRLRRIHLYAWYVPGYVPWVPTRLRLQLPLQLPRWPRVSEVIYMAFLGKRQLPFVREHPKRPKLCILLW